MTGETNIGLNPLTSTEPIWYAGPDLAASALLSQRRPKVIKAIRILPVRTQVGLTSTVLGDRPINPARDNFFRAVIENRQQLDPSDPLNYFLKILANAGGYGIYAELNRKQFGKNSPKQLHIYSGEHYRKQLATTIEEAGPWYFPPASLITAGGRLLLAMLEKVVSNAGGSYLMADTDSLAIISTKSGGLVACNGGNHRLPDGREAIKTLAWEQAKEIAEKFSSLNPYDPEVVPHILKVENYNFDRQGNQHQLYGFAISAKRYVLFTRDGTIIKPSEHGLGPYFHLNTRRYAPKNCKNQKDSYPEWMVQGWEWILRHHNNDKDARSPKWSPILAMRKVAVTTPTVLASLRRIDPDSAKPYNFVISPMALFGGPTLVGPFCDDPTKWAGLEDGPDYVSVEDGTLFRLCKPGEDEFVPGAAVGKNSTTVTKYLLSAQLRDLEQVFRDYVQHPEAKSLAPDGTPCTATTYGLLRRRPIHGVPPFRLIGKEVDRSAQADYAVFSDAKALDYGSSQSEENVLMDNRNSIVQMLEQRLKSIPIKELARQTGVDRNAIRRVLCGERVHSKTRLRLLKAASS